MSSQGQDLVADALPRLLTAPRRMRVCHIVSADLWAGAEVQVATVASYLAERADVEVSAVLLNEGPLARELRRLGIPTTVIDERQNSAIRIVIALARWLRSHPVDIVHTHRYKETVLGTIAARLAGVPNVIRTVHGQSEPMRGWQALKFRTYAALDTLTLRCFAERIIAVSRRMADSLEQSGYKPGTIVTVHNGVDLRKVVPTRPREDVRRELGIGPATVLIGTVGRLSPIKGHAHFLRAARLIRQGERGVKFLIVGDGPLRGDLQNAARQLEIDDACVFVGARTDVYDLVNAMDVFVLPSLHEGMPMALLEAMALGIPVVATAVGGVTEVVAHRANGLLVESRDELGLAEACLELALDPRGARELATRARRTVEEAFSHEQSGRELVKVYRAVTRRPGAAGMERVRSLAAPVARAARKLRDIAVSWPDRRRMDRIRRDPSQLVAALRTARRILIVCHGNIIRSPFAARLVAQALGGGREVSIVSGGLGARPGTPAPPAATRIAATLQVDLGGHVASPVTPDAVATSDVIFVMDIAQLRVVQRRFPQAHAKAFLLTCLVPEWPLEVRDPFDADDSAFQSCFEHISASVHPIVGLLAGRATIQ